MTLDLAQDPVSLTAALVDVASVSGTETHLADLVEDALRALPHLAVERDGDAVVARTELGRERRVLLAGHLDTVPTAGNLPSRLDGDRLYGCGTSDMKAGDAVLNMLGRHGRLRRPLHETAQTALLVDDVGLVLLRADPRVAAVHLEQAAPAG